MDYTEVYDDAYDGTNAYTAEETRSLRVSKYMQKIGVLHTALLTIAFSMYIPLLFPVFRASLIGAGLAPFIAMIGTVLFARAIYYLHQHSTDTVLKTTINYFGVMTLGISLLHSYKDVANSVPLFAGLFIMISMYGTFSGILDLETSRVIPLIMSLIPTIGVMVLCNMFFDLDSFVLIRGSLYIVIITIYIFASVDRNNYHNDVSESNHCVLIPFAYASTWIYFAHLLAFITCNYVHTM
jgi:hypothetical protein